VENTPPLGPAPTGPPPRGSSSLSPARERLAVALAERPEGATISELHEEVGGHANTVRFHLDGLVTDGLASRSPRAGAGRGRPSMAYRLTPAGVAALGGGSDALTAEYLGLATAFATHLAERDDHPQEEARAVGRVWGRQLVGADDAGSRPGTPPRRRVVGLLARLGFSPEVDETPANDGTRDASAKDASQQQVSLLACPLLAAAREHPDVICSVHEGLVTGALKAYGAADDTARLVPFARPGACHLLLGTGGNA
jgi:predicted ArsR family transcriptional regulator